MSAPADSAELDSLAALGAAALELASRVQATPTVDRLAFTLDEAAAALGMSRDFFDRHVRPDLRIIRKGGSDGEHARCRRFVAKVELERWLEENGVAVKP